MNKFSRPSGTPEMVKYITKANINTIKERAEDDLTGASYVADIAPNMTLGQGMCVAATAASSSYFGPSYGPQATAVVNYYVNKACAPVGQYVDYIVDYLGENHASENQGDPMEHGSMGIEEPDDYGQGAPSNNDADTDTSSTNDSKNDSNNDDDNGDNDEGGLWDAVVDAWNGLWGDDADAEPGGDKGNPNPYDDGSQGSTSKPTIGPAPGDIGGRYSDMFNPGEDRGFTPGDGGDGDGNPGNPWDRSDRMSTPNDDGDPIDPLTGFSGGSDPNDGDSDGDGSPFDDELYRPNPEDDYGTGLSFVIEAAADFSSAGVENLSDASATSSIQAFVATMSAEAVEV